MCELLGLTSNKKIRMNELLKTFFSHSTVHRDGWGFVELDRNPISIEKEPTRAVDSSFLREKLAHRVETSKCLAHIRQATIGDVCPQNTHPFVKCDDTGRQWVLIHNGTIFDAHVLSPYQYLQEGTSDSERVLLYIIAEINRRYRGNPEARTLDAVERFRVVEEALRTIAPGNKLNAMLYDGDYFYVHKNAPGALFKKEEPGTVLFATQPLQPEGWEEAPLNQLLVYRDGTLVYTGRKHNGTYIHDEEKMKLLFMAYSGL